MSPSARHLQDAVLGARAEVDVHHGAVPQFLGAFIGGAKSFSFGAPVRTLQL
jgi:hypothetical protein